MSTIRNHRIRFMTNNLGATVTPTITSEQGTYPATNLFTEQRFQPWKSDGNFTIDASNSELYVTDGAGDQTISLTPGNYTGISLSGHIKTQLDAGTDRTWTVTYSTSAYDFNLVASASSTLKLSSTINAAWDMLGYAGTVDRTGTSFPADEVRIHTHESMEWDFTVPYEIGFVAGIVEVDEIMQLSSSATIKIQGSNVANWTSPPLDVTITPDTEGFMAFTDGETTNQYRYWRLYIEDRNNPVGPDAISIGHLYLGDYVTLTERNVNTGFSKTKVDLSKGVSSEGGTEYFRLKPKYTKYDSVSMAYLNANDRRGFEQLFHNVGISSSFFVSFDPTLQCTENVQELTKYVRFTAEPKLTHVRSDTYSVSMAFKESI